eukprot:m.22351 g.22351  ORF g.22351 m.22351 type:complete len:76 (-) comp5449_c1_seq2:2558-2785(-)
MACSSCTKMTNQTFGWIQSSLLVEWYDIFTDAYNHACTHTQIHLTYITIVNPLPPFSLPTHCIRFTLLNFNTLGD